MVEIKIAMLYRCDSGTVNWYLFESKSEFWWFLGLWAEEFYASDL